MAGRLPITLLSALAWARLTTALVPADPTITAAAILPRQNNDRFIGWVEASGTWYSEQCNSGLTWYQDNKYAQCCPVSLASCYAPTACVSGSLIYPYSDKSTTRTIACTENFGNSLYSVCNTAFIFENFGDSNPKTDIVCGESSVNWSYYRKVPATATEKIATTPLPSSAIPNSAPAAASPTTSQVNTEKKGSSKAWIAGAVAGPIIGIALIGLIAFFLIRRKKKATTQPVNGSTTLAATGGAPAGVGVGGFENKPQMSQPPVAGGFNPNSAYNQNAEQNQYGQPPLSPAPQYSAPYAAPGSPPPQGHYVPDHKQTYQHTTQAHPDVAELGGASSTTPMSGAAELPSNSK
ncbi:hypothetical protein B0J11DRAFT_586836 [Dendryphion nanum]|uniref:Uncharacterized protein n=1 Tax=Dendryphion nanum TaxID=256645 RepID=A0A9P9I5N3_9PLEO|nr:hypothetical protein B0J11DRAFT_586836 [Dendryphion nanum]